MSVIVPFAGSVAEARQTLGQLARLNLRGGDEVVVIDNQPGGALPHPRDGPLRVLRDAAHASSYYARNRGAEETANEWMLFLDSDCRPSGDLLDAYFGAPVPDECGVVAGGVVSANDQGGHIAAYARSRRQVSERIHAEAAARPAGITANLLVHRAAWEQAGGFQEGLRSGADVEFCWRLQELGWSPEHRPEAAVEHVHPTGLRRLLAKARRYGAGRVWVNRRYPGEAPPPRLLRPLARCAAGVAVWTLTLRPRRALFKLIDALWFLAMARGYWAGDNRATRSSIPPMDGAAVLLAGEFPQATDEGMNGPAPASEIPDRVGRVEARARPARPDPSRSREIPIAYREDDPPIERLGAVIWLWARHPVLSVAYRRRVGEHSESLAALAPAVRRLCRMGPRDLAVDRGPGASGERLLRLAGLELRASGLGTGPRQR